MKKLRKLLKPENYKISEKDLTNMGNFDSLLDHLTDIVISEPLHNISLNSNGISSQKTMISIEDIERPNIYQTILCDISIGVDLKENRGIHMSRCVQSIFELAQKKFASLDEFAVELGESVQSKQDSKTAFVEVSGMYFRKTKTKKTSLDSQDSIFLLSSAIVSKSNTRLKTGLKAYNTTACPCTRTYTKYSVVPELKAMGLNLKQINKILDITYSGTHMQRGTMTLMLDKDNAKVSYLDLYNILDKSTHLVYELLKRPDEHDLVIRALRKPQFTEDVAREVAYNAYEAFKDILPSEAGLYVESLLHDSIHIHDVKTVISKTFGDIQHELDNK
jgi:GTP cyclohydrolase IV